VNASSRIPRLTRLAMAASIAVMTVFGVATTAQANTDATVIIRPGGTFCEFDVTETILTDNTKTISNPSGDRSTGHFVVEFAANGKSQTFNVSGAVETSVSGTTATQTFTGPSFFLIGLKGQANTGAPGISYSPGRTVVVYDISQSPAVVTSFSPTAPVTNICALLA
jgi:hypothetical protein